MFKRLLVLVCLALLSSQAFAAIYIVEPVDRKVLPVDSGEISFGKIARGETLKVVAKKKTDLGFEWDSLSVDPSLLPGDWSVKGIETDKTVIALITVSADAQISTQRIKFTAGNATQPMFSETFYASVSVHENLLSASIENPSQTALLGKGETFKLVLNNDSLAEHLVAIESSLPGYWFSPQTLQLKPNEIRLVELPVFPYSYGEKNFQFAVSSKQNSKQFLFPVKLNVKPTLVGIYRAGIAGFPFFSPGLLPHYLINGLLSLFQVS